jgi:membrane associated rhomboid family serine protease
MASRGTLQIALPEFSGVTRRLVLTNLFAFFALLILTTAKVVSPEWVLTHLGFVPQNFLSGEVWQLVTYSFIHPGLLSTLFELLMLWFMGSLLEEWHGGQWFGSIYAASVLGGAVVATVIYALGIRMGTANPQVVLVGCNYGLFGLLTAIGVLHGDIEFRLFFLIVIKARYLAIIYALIALASAFGDYPTYAFAELGAGLAAVLYIRLAPRRGFDFRLSEGWYGLRNRYFRWKRRRAASKFQVYMKKQGRTVRFDGQGRLIDEDDVKHEDRKRWN